MTDSEASLQVRTGAVVDRTKVHNQVHNPESGPGPVLDRTGPGTKVHSPVHNDSDSTCRCGHRLADHGNWGGRCCLINECRCITFRRPATNPTTPASSRPRAARSGTRSSTEPAQIGSAERGHSTTAGCQPGCRNLYQRGNIAGHKESDLMRVRHGGLG